MSDKTKIIIEPDQGSRKISRYIYGNFAEHLGKCIYNGIWVGKDSTIKNEQGIRKDTAGALKDLDLPVLRWPGGCFADNYHWKDGIGPRNKRPKRHNLWWNQPESNHFGTDEFLHFCKMIGVEPYICLNVGSGTVEEARAWVEYCNSEQFTLITEQRRKNGQLKPYNVKFWGIGNENWGCGGSMKPEYYADLYRRFATYVRGTAGEGSKLIACGSHPGIPEWDEIFLKGMRGALELVDYIAIHIYSGAGASDINFKEEDYYRLISSIDIMDDNISRVSALVRSYSSPGHSIGVILDEWGTWYKEATVQTGLYQQNTMKDALFTAVSFHCFHNHERLFMTNMAQTVNVLQSLVLTEGGKAILTPTYYIYDMFKPHKDAILVSSKVEKNAIMDLPDGKTKEAISVSATVSEDKKELFLSIINLDLINSIDADISVVSDEKWEIKEIRQLSSTDIHDHNTFSKPNKVKPLEIKSKIVNKFPVMSVTTVKMKIVS